MSDLQLGLIVLGVLVVIGVYAFNRVQERQLQRRIERPPGDPRRPVDPETQSESHASQRLEPHVGIATDAQYGQGDLPRVSIPSNNDAAAADARANVANVVTIDYVCRIDAPEPLPPAMLATLIGEASAIGKPISVRGWDEATQQWSELTRAAPTPVARVAVALQLADRAGATNRVQLSSLRDLVKRVGEQVGAQTDCPEIDDAAQAALDLDRFCAEVDISLGCNVVPANGATLAGTKLRGLLESAGFVPEASGRFVLRTEEGVALVSVEDIEGAALSPERMREGAIAGVVLSMDVPRVPNGTRTFDRMIEIARHLAHALDAAVVDDNRTALTEPGLKLIRQQLRNVHAAMEAHGIPAGSALAFRLFV